MLDVELQNLSAEDAAHLLYRGQDPACSGQMPGRTEAKSHCSTPLERVDVLGGSVDEPLESGGACEEGPGELPHPFTADH